MYLHELGNPADSFTRADMHMGKHLLRDPHLPPPSNPLPPGCKTALPPPRRDLLPPNLNVMLPLPQLALILNQRTATSVTNNQSSTSSSTSTTSKDRDKEIQVSHPPSNMTTNTKPSVRLTVSTNIIFG